MIQALLTRAYPDMVREGKMSIPADALPQVSRANAQANAGRCRVLRRGGTARCLVWVPFRDTRWLDFVLLLLR